MRRGGWFPNFSTTGKAQSSQLPPRFGDNQEWSADLSGWQEDHVSQINTGKTVKMNKILFKSIQKQTEKPVKCP